MVLTPLEKYNLYKSQQQKVNSSSRYTPPPREPTNLTARQILAQRDQRNQVVQQEKSKYIPPKVLNTVSFKALGNEPARLVTYTHNNGPYLKVGDKLPNAENIIPKPRPEPNYSQGTREFLASSKNLISKLKEAKESGFTNLDIYDETGAKIGSINPQDVQRARYDALKLSLGSSGPITLRGSMTKTTTETVTEQPEQIASVKDTLAFFDKIGLKEEKPKDFWSGIGEGVKKDVRNIGVTFAQIPEAVSIIASGKGEKTGLLGLPGFAPQGTTETAGTKLFDGKIGEIDITKGEDVGSLIFTGGLTFAPIGGVKGARSGLGKIGETIGESKATQIAKGLHEDNLLFQLEQPVKGSKVFEFEQGTVGKSGVTSSKIEPAESYLGRVETPTEIDPFKETFVEGKVSTIKPELPPIAKKTETIIGVGAKGEKVKIKQEPHVELGNLESEGEAKVPLALINPKGATSVIRTSINDELPVNYILAKDITPGQAVDIGLESAPGLKNVYYGKATRHTIEKLELGIKSGKIKAGTDIFQFYSKDFAQNPSLYGAVTRNPKLLKGGNFSKLVRPNVIRYFEGTNPGGYELKPNIENIVSGKGTRKMTPFKPSELGGVNIGDIGAGAAGRAKNLLTEFEKLTPVEPIKPVREYGVTSDLSPTFGVGMYFNINPSGVGGKGKYKTNKPEYGKGIYLNIPVSGLGPSKRKLYDATELTMLEENSRLNQRKNKIFFDTELISLAYPPGTSGKMKGKMALDVIDKLNINSKLSEKLGEKDILKDVLKTIGVTKQKEQGISIKLVPDEKIKEDITGGIKLDIGLDVTTKQREIPDTIFTDITIPKPPERPPPGMRYLTIGGGDWFSGGYGKNKKRGGFSKATFFTYSVNPNVVGVIAEAGKPGKIVSSSLGNLARFGKAKRSKGKGKGKGKRSNNIDSFSNIGNFGKIKI